MKIYKVALSPDKRSLSAKLLHVYENEVLKNKTLKN